MIFNVDVARSGALGTHALSLKESALLRLRLNNAFPLSELKMQYGMLEDLLKLLTDSDFGLDWPRVSLADGPKYRWYFFRSKSNESIAAPKHHDTVTNFPELRDQFGSIWSRWKAKREEFGPGIYLYLGTRRGMPLYVEHRFVNLIWGLEAFHRKKGDPGKSDALTEKIERVIGQVGSKDKRWLKYQLRNASEPTLEQRLLEVFVALPIGLDKSRLRTFSKACADRRNEISHFGGQKHAKPYSVFGRDLHRKSNTLSTLYHALLLHEIGIDAAIINRWLYTSFGSHRIKVNFVEAGLLDPSTLPTGDHIQEDGASDM